MRIKNKYLTLAWLASCATCAAAFSADPTTPDWSDFDQMWKLQAPKNDANGSSSPGNCMFELISGYSYVRADGTPGFYFDEKIDSDSEGVPDDETPGDYQVPYLDASDLTQEIMHKDEIRLNGNVLTHKTTIPHSLWWDTVVGSHTYTLQPDGSLEVKWTPVHSSSPASDCVYLPIRDDIQTVMRSRVSGVELVHSGQVVASCQLGADSKCEIDGYEISREFQAQPDGQQVEISSVAEAPDAKISIQFDAGNPGGKLRTSSSAQINWMVETHFINDGNYHARHTEQRDWKPYAEVTKSAVESIGDPGEYQLRLNLAQ